MALVIAGAASLAAGHLGSIAIASEYDFRDHGGWFFAPIAGPFVYLATRGGCGAQDDEFTGAACSFGNTMLIMAVVTDGLFQLGGAIMLTAGLLMDTAPKPPKPEEVRLRPILIPTNGGAMSGVSIVF